MEQEQMMQQLQQLVMAAMQGDQQAQQQIMQVKQAAEQGDQQAAQIMQVITQLIQSMQGQQGGQQPQMARHGAKLAYIKSLQGCPEGTEAQYFAKGGKVCKKCVEAAKCGNKMKKAAKGTDLKPKSGNTKTVEGIRKEIKGKRSGKPMPTKYDDKKHERLAGLTKPTPAQKDSLETYRNQFKRMSPAQQQRYEKTGD